MAFPMASKKRNATIAAQDYVPAGFRKVETSISGFWKPEGAGEFLQGIVGAPVEVKGRDDDKPNTFYPLQLTSADGGPIVSGTDKAVKAVEMRIGMIVGVGGKMLGMFLREREGKEVFLVYRGLGKAKPGQSAPKMFDTFEAEREGE